jgi:hypothetical protein
LRPYKNLSGKAGVVAYDFVKDGIQIQFNSGDTYLYTYRSAGESHIQTMRELAIAGRGLSTYISQHHPQYEAKF